jgi:hypothetical protein
MNEVAEEHYAKRNRVTREILMQAINEECKVVTPFGTRHGLYFLDCDKDYAMFKDKGSIVIIELREIKILEYPNEEDKDGEYIQNENPEERH